ncbi:MAG: nicotinamide mononucleotide transporter [Planctomycetaceae bacterium]|nr:nicotinamide mononucleotide transporter [Planctomycetaceae bacterium]
MTFIEVIAVIFGLLCVWLTIRQNIWCWPTGLVQVVLYIFIFYQVKLYSDLILHVIYVFLQLYGWFHWLKGNKGDTSLPVTLLEQRSRSAWIATMILGTCAWGYLMATRTDAAVPYGDAFTTVTSLIAQWLMARKKLESWLFWIAVDVVAIGIYWTKSLYLTSGLYAVFLVLAILGWFAWKRTCMESGETA